MLNTSYASHTYLYYFSTSKCSYIYITNILTKLLVFISLFILFFNLFFNLFKLLIRFIK